LADQLVRRVTQDLGKAPVAALNDAIAEDHDAGFGILENELLLAQQASVGLASVDFLGNVADDPDRGLAGFCRVDGASDQVRDESAAVAARQLGFEIHDLPISQLRTCLPAQGIAGFAVRVENEIRLAHQGSRGQPNSSSARWLQR
jgi:hypothetical protein